MRAAICGLRECREQNQARVLKNKEAIAWAWRGYRRAGGRTIEACRSAALARSETGAAVEGHAENGSGAERLVPTTMGFGLASEQIVPCPVDKFAGSALPPAPLPGELVCRNTTPSADRKIRQSAEPGPCSSEC